MYGIIIYLLQSGACLAGFYFVYKLFLSRETLHRFNRLLLLSVIAVSAVLPLCRITVEREIPVVATDTVATVGEIPAVEIIETEGFDRETAVCILFALGAAAMVARLIFSIASVRKIIASGTTATTDDGIALTTVYGETKPFSWMRHIVISAKETEEDKRVIIAHERAHIQLHHSWDIMAVDIIGCLQWFNPALWLLRRELQSLHEYEADAAVLESGVNIKEYQMLLIKKAVGGRLLTIANCLNHSNLKNRITMMLQKPSSRWSAGKALLMLPLVGLSLGAFARTVYVLPEEQDKVMQNSSNDQIVGIENPADTLKGSVVTVRKADGTTLQTQTQESIRTITIKGKDTAAAEQSEMSIYINGQKVDFKDPEKLNDLPDFKKRGELNNLPAFSEGEFSAKIILDGKQVTAEEFGKVDSSHIDNIVVDKSSGENVIRITTKTISTTVTATPGRTKSEKSKKTIILNSKVGDVVTHLGGTKILLNGKQITSEELDAIDSSKIEGIVIDKSSSDERVVRVTTKSNSDLLDDYSQLKNAVVCVDGKIVKASALKTLDNGCITNMFIDKRDGKNFINITTKDGKWQKKPKSKKR